MASTAQDTQLRLFVRRVKANTNDTEALEELYKIATNYRYGWKGYRANTQMFQKVMGFVAKHGHPEACYELARGVIRENPTLALAYILQGLDKHPENEQLQGMRSTLEAINRQKDSEHAQRLRAEEIFANREGLFEAIQDEIFPGVVSLTTERGVVGTGFYQHSEWLVSNAHVIPNFETLSGSELTDFRGARTMLRAKRAFHRPNGHPKSPDIVIMKRSVRERGSNRCLPMDMSDDGDTGRRIHFYVWFNHQTQQHEIKILKPCSKEGEFPMQFACEDGSEPIPGCSGAPVLSARLLVGGHDIQWKFDTVGVVFARCPSAGSKLVCALPVKHDFKQLLDDVLFPEDFAKRAGHMADASRTIRAGEEQISKHESRKVHYQTLAEQGLYEFEAGKTQLDIELPDGLERLLGKEILGLKGSAFLSDVQKKYKITDTRVTGKTKTIEELREDFYDFLLALKKEPNIQLKGKQGDSFRLSPKGYFRVDLAGGNNTDHYTLDIQDNIGKGLHAPPPHSTEPVSSKFAIAMVAKNFNDISGAELVRIFLSSIKHETKDILKTERQQRRDQAEQESKEAKPLMFSISCYKHEWVSAPFNSEDAAYHFLDASTHKDHQAQCSVLPIEDTSPDESLDLSEEAQPVTGGAQGAKKPKKAR